MPNKVLERRRLPAKRQKWRRPNLQPREPISLDAMPPVPRAMVKRISQIWGIPVREMETVYAGKTQTRFARGMCNRISFEIRSSTKQAVLGHELVHSNQDLLAPLNYAERQALKGEAEEAKMPNAEKAPTQKGKQKNAFYEHAGKKDGIDELTARAPHKRQWLDGGGFRKNTAIGFIASTLPVVVGLELLLLRNPAWPYLLMGSGGVIGATRFSRLYTAYRAGGYFRRHGVDGLILIFVNPPKDFKASKMFKWEREMVAKGYLLKKGGMTRKGMQLARSLQPREMIFKRAKQARKCKSQK
ncbi:MAG: hypothetical protein NT067_03130 [Candidatus Diapherotrites archaeon]|nr:hypothetical protein [Candidatus Diapherotrites archaeon]